jgi:hypothetical protein
MPAKTARLDRKTAYSHGSAIYSPVLPAIALFGRSTRFCLHSAPLAGAGRLGGPANLGRLHGVCQHASKSVPDLLNIGRLAAMAAAGHPNGSIGTDPMGEPLLDEAPLGVREGLAPRNIQNQRHTSPHPIDPLPPRPTGRRGLDPQVSGRNRHALIDGKIVHSGPHAAAAVGYCPITTCTTHRPAARDSFTPIPP